MVCSTLFNLFKFILFIAEYVWLYGAVVARLTPDQKAGCSNHSGVMCIFVYPFFSFLCPLTFFSENHFIMLFFLVKLYFLAKVVREALGSVPDFVYLVGLEMLLFTEM